MEQIIRKYNEQDPLPQALGHSESTKLFASRAGTAERQSAALLADRREIAPAQHKNSSSSAGKKRKIQDVSVYFIFKFKLTQSLSGWGRTGDCTSDGGACQPCGRSNIARAFRV